MKSNRIYIVAAIFLLSGLLVMGIAFSAVRFNWRRLETDQYTDRVYLTKREVTALTVDDFNTPVELIPWDGDTVEIQYQDSTWGRYTIEEADGLLRVKRNRTAVRWFRMIQFNLRRTTLKIRIPKELRLELELKTSNARIELSDLTFKSVILKSSNGALSLRDVSVDSDLDLKTSNGPVTLRKTSAGGCLSVENSNGRISAEEISVPKLTLDTSNSLILLEKAQGEEIKLITSNGKITVEEVSAERELWLKSSNGKITGTLPGKITDYTIQSNTSNGSNSLPENLRGGKIHLTVKTSNSSIDLDFEND